MMDGSLPTGEANELPPDWHPAAPEVDQPIAVLRDQDFDYLDDLMGMLQVPGERESGSVPEKTQCATAPPKDDVGLAFLEWLREGVHSHRLVLNDSKAKVHTVDGTFFLVTPGIFQLYTAEHPESAEADSQSDAWRRIQHHFEKLDAHLRKPNRQNIWTCTVRGPRKTTSLNGYILRDVNLLGLPPPPDNPFLSLRPPIP